MKFSVNKADFFFSLQKVIGVIPAKTTIPILSNILLKLDNDRLVLSATDLEISIDTRCEVTDAEGGGITVPGRKLYDIIRELPDLPLQLESDERNHLKLTTDKGIYKFIGESEDEYPQIAVEDAESEFALPSERLIRMIDKTIFAVSSDELRSTLMGVYLQLLAGELRMVATDGHRLARIGDLSYAGKDTESAVTLPTKALQLIAKNAEGGEQDVQVSIGENHATFALGETKIYSKLIEGQFPNYERVIPSDNELNMYVNRDLLTAAVRRVSIFASQYTHQIKCTVTPSSLMIQAEDVEMGGEAQESIPVDYSGEKLEIGYNAAYLLDILRHMDSEELMFKLKDSASAAIIRPSEQNENEDLMMLIMPIRLNDAI